MTFVLLVCSMTEDLRWIVLDLTLNKKLVIKG